MIEPALRVPRPSRIDVRQESSFSRKGSTHARCPLPLQACRTRRHSVVAGGRAQKLEAWRVTDVIHRPVGVLRSIFTPETSTETEQVEGDFTYRPQPFYELRNGPVIFYSLEPVETIGIDALNSFWAEANSLVPRDPAKFKRAIRNSYIAIALLLERKGQDGKISYEIVGFARAISDGAFVATLEDVCIHEKYRNRGLGTKMVHFLMNESRRKGLRLGHGGPASFAAFTTSNKRMFFSRCGFSLDMRHRWMTLSRESLAEIVAAREHESCENQEP